MQQKRLIINSQNYSDFISHHVSLKVDERRGDFQWTGFFNRHEYYANGTIWRTDV